MKTRVFYVCVGCGAECDTELSNCLSHYPTKQGKPRLCFLCSTYMDRHEAFTDLSNIPEVAGRQDLDEALFAVRDDFTDEDIAEALDHYNRTRPHR